MASGIEKGALLIRGEDSTGRPRTVAVDTATVLGLPVLSLLKTVQLQNMTDQLVYSKEPYQQKNYTKPQPETHLQV